jgi:hypothetical protein
MSYSQELDGSTYTTEAPRAQSPRARGSGALVYTIRPDGTALWLSEEVAAEIGARYGDRLTREQYEGPDVQRLLLERCEKFMTNPKRKEVRAA